MKEFFNELQRQGFRRTHRGRAKHDCHIYTKEFPDMAGTYEHNGLKKTTNIEVQLWFDGGHRVSYMLNSCSDRTPISFTNKDEMMVAIANTMTELTKRWQRHVSGNN